MRRLGHRIARRWWSGELGRAGRVLSVLAVPLSWVWAGVAAARNRRFDRAGGVSVPGIRVVSVGNVTVGGTGKTPIAGWLARRLRDGGATPAVVLRGYGRDEAELHRRWNPDVPVVVGRDRIEAVRRARDAGADVAILDDGFQHRRLARDVDIVLVAVEDPFPGPVLPRGPYRESARALRRAHAILVTRRSASKEDARVLGDRIALRVPDVLMSGVRLVTGEWRDLRGHPTDPVAGPVLAVAAVARPESFAEAVERRGVRGVELLSFPDHHEYTAGEVEKLRERAGGRTIVVTEKDAVKLASHAASLGDVRVLPLDVEWDWGEADLLRLLGVP